MKTVALLYHDVIRNGDFAASGFPGADANIYKLEEDSFRRHLAAIVETGQRPLMTFDDGGVSAIESIAPLLEEKHLSGYFFIATNWIGRSGFLNRDQIRELRERGHMIGSHSCSHPERISHLPWNEICDEWKRSVDILSDLLEEPVTMASVPGGFSSIRVARAASIAGIRNLFTSDPITTNRKVDTSIVFGRFMVQRSTSPATALALVRGDTWPRFQQFLLWNTKKGVKRVGGTAWLRFRRWALSRSSSLG